MNWRVIYVLSFIVYLALNMVVTSVGGMPPRTAALFSFSITLPPALAGIFVVRWFRAERGALRNGLFGAAFAIVCVLGTLVILWAGVPSERFRFRLDSTLYGMILAGLIFAILASVTHVQRMQSELARAEALRARAELSALRARIDPHFLFNTLHSLLALVRQDPSRAEDAIEQFADILRYTFAASDGSEERTLQQEWQLVDNYLALERLRLGKRLRVTESLDPAVAQTPVPVLTLQPLVENAIRHAVAPRAGGGSIEIHATRVDGSVRIDVCDDGPGVSPDALATTRGQGLQLVRERLERMYFGDAKLELGRAPAGGLCVSIILPMDDE